jgi:hypothetical protein
VRPGSDAAPRHELLGLGFDGSGDLSEVPGHPGRFQSSLEGFEIGSRVGHVSCLSTV